MSEDIVGLLLSDLLKESDNDALDEQFNKSVQKNLYHAICRLKSDESYDHKLVVTLLECVMGRLVLELNSPPDLTNSP